jgi:hypothetical protein
MRRSSGIFSNALFIRTALLLAGFAAQLALASPAAAEVVQLTASMDSAQADAGTGTGTPGTGTAIMTLDTSTNTLTWNISWSGLLGPPFSMHFHGPAQPNQNAGIQITTGVADPPVLGNAVINDDQKSDLLAGLWYLNLHTFTFPDGEIRGRVLAATSGSAGDVTNLTVARSGTDLVLSWGVDCGSGDTYSVYRGDLTLGYGSMAFDLCSITPTNVTIPTAAPDNEFFLVVPASNDEEGSYGASTAGTRLPAPGACHPQGPLNECTACVVPCNEGETCFPGAGCIVEFSLEPNRIFLADGLVTELWVIVAPDWLDSNDVSLAIEISGLNAGPHPHGFQEVLASATQLLAIDNGEALVSVDWTTDQLITHSPETYTACVQAMVNGQTFGLENCAAFGPF